LFRISRKYDVDDDDDDDDADDEKEMKMRNFSCIDQHKICAYPCTDVGLGSKL